MACSLAALKWRPGSFARHCLLNGVDQLGYLLQHSDAITEYEQAQEAA